jgi:2-aminoethylphosphonate-pyruvate transaminase
MKSVSLTPAVFHLSDEVNAVAAAYAANPIVPRGPKLHPVLTRLQTRIKSALGCAGSHEVVILTCSGSGAVAAALGACVADGGILVVSNGAYGERQARYALQMGLKTVHYRLAYGVRPDVQEIENLARESQVASIGLVHGATSTCSLNPLQEVGEVAHRLGLTFIVDAISSVFVEEIDVAACHIDVLIASSNKGLHSNPDLALVLVERTCLEEALARPGRLPYLDLSETWRAQRDGSHPYTINLRALLELDASLDGLERSGGVPGRIELYRRRLGILRTGYRELGLKTFQQPGMPLQNIGTALYLPEGVDFDRLAGALASWNDGSGESYEIYAAQGELSADVFRIFNLGEYPLDTYRRFITALGATLEKLSNA